MFYYWIILIVAFILLWLFLGRNNTEFVGLNPLFSDKPLPKDPFALNPFSVKKQITGPESNRFDIGCDISRLNNPSPPPVKTFVKENNRFSSKGQKLCREIMEEIYGKSFGCARPSWLKNPETGGILEIDCYNDQLKIGVEYNGIQHYVYPNVYHKSLVEFKNQVRRDQYKLKKCEENGVYLITVPYNIPHSKIREYIMEHLPDEEDYTDQGQDTGQDTDEVYLDDGGVNNGGWNNGGETEEDDGEEDEWDEMENEIEMLDDNCERINIPTAVCYKEYLA
jgi:hypothetical protein